MDSKLTTLGAVKWRLVVLAVAGAVGLSAVASFTTAQDDPVRAFTPAPGASFADVVERVSPAVVNISVKKRARPLPASGPRGRSPLDEFFGRFFDMPEQRGTPRAPRYMEGQGSGFLIDADGYVATNRHVIEDAAEVVVTLSSGEQLDATIVGQDARTDLALLKVDAGRPLGFVSFGDSDRARIGDWVLAIGNPFGLGGTATAGIISARGRDIQSGPYDDYLQIDAPINSGNSGGPVFNGAGEVIGINTAIFSPNGGNIGIGFAIPANQARAVIAELKSDGAVDRGWLGVQIQDVDATLAETLGLDAARGALVAEVVSGSPAAAAGLEPGDVILGLDGADIDSAKTLGRLVGDRDSGEAVELAIWRDGRRLERQVTLGALETAERVARERGPADGGRAELGLTLENLDDARRAELGLRPDAEGALVVAVAPRSEAARQGIRPGDVIVSVDRKRTATAEDALGALAESEGRALVLVRRGDSQRFVALGRA